MISLQVKEVVTLDPKTDKLLVIDFSEVFFTSVFAWRRMLTYGHNLPLEFVALRKIFSYVKQDPTRKIILVADGVHSWRKDVYPDYKGQRKAQRDSFDDLDWPDLFNRYAQMLSMFDLYTPFITFRDDNLEADDFIAVLANDGYDMDVFSTDKDLHQLCIHPAIRLYSLKAKKKKNKFVPKDIKNPVHELEKLIIHGDRADNIPPAKNNEAQKIINKKLVDLLQLPTEVTTRARLLLQQERIKVLDIEKFYEVYSWDFVLKELGRLVP